MLAPFSPLWQRGRCAGQCATGDPQAEEAEARTARAAVECAIIVEPMSEDLLKKLKDEIKTLEEELHLKLPKELKAAREHGDLSENAEYQAAKERQRYVDARLAQLKKRLAELSLVNLSKIPEGKITLLDLEKNEEVVYRLVMSEEADVQKGLISTTSPIGRGLMGKQEGVTVEIETPNGRRSFEIVKLVTIHEKVSPP
jgi:transcription elongation factor GreA